MAGPKRTEILVGVDFVSEFAGDQLDHDGVIDVTKHWHAIGNDVVGIGKIGQRREHIFALFGGQLPFCVTHHVDQRLDAIDALFNLNNGTYEAWSGTDTLSLTALGDALFVTDAFGQQVIWGTERIIAGAGIDLIILAHETLILGDVVIAGGTEDDVIWANAGDDAVVGQAGNDLIDGGPGNDTLIGEDGDDTLYGGAGDDTLNGGAGSDQLVGNEGDDTLIFDIADILIDGSSGFDTLRLPSATSIDVTALAQGQIAGIERFDLESGVVNEVTLDLLSLLALSDSTNDLYIIGDDGPQADVINLSDFIDSGSDLSVDGRVYDQYVALGSDARLFIEQGLTVI